MFHEVTLCTGGLDKFQLQLCWVDQASCHSYHCMKSFCPLHAEESWEFTLWSQTFTVSMFHEVTHYQASCHSYHCMRSSCPLHTEESISWKSTLWVTNFHWYPVVERPHSGTHAWIEACATNSSGEAWSQGLVTTWIVSQCKMSKTATLSYLPLKHKLTAAYVRSFHTRTVIIAITVKMSWVEIQASYVWRLLT